MSYGSVGPCGRIGSLLISFLLFASFLFSQTITTGDILGTVKDASGAVVAGASVTLKNLDSGETQTATTNGSGTYRFSLLKPGNYSVAANASGLQSDLERANLRVGEALTVDIIAKVQSTQQVVEVQETGEAVDTDNANLTTTFGTKQLNALPMPGGDLTTVAFTVPGVVVSTGAGYGNFSSHGLPGTSNLYTMNGNDYNDAYLNLNNSGASNLLLGQNEVAEASVTQNGYSVQYGRQAGAQVNYITKSGTNALHGDLLFSFNNHLMNANDFFNNTSGTPRPYDVSRQWGADIGGPILKNKLFFYSDSEGIYYTLPSSGTVVAPSPQLQAYILNTVSAAAAPIYQKAFGIYASAPGAGNARPVTTGSGLTQDSTGSLGCGSVFSGTAAPGGGIFGTDVSCATAYRTNGLNTNKEWLETHRVDWNISDKQKIFFRFKGDHGFQPTATSLLTPTLNEQSIQPQYEGQINHTWVISPTMVNNIIGSVLWYSAIFGPASTTAAETLFPNYLTVGGDSSGTNSGGFTPMGINWSAFPQGRDVGQFQLSDDFSLIKGNHTIKVGVNFRKNQITDFSYETGSIGSYFFSNLADYANGVTNSSANGTSYYLQKFSPLQDAHIRVYNLGVYLQDEWAIKSNVKLTYGVRFDRTANPSCLDKCFANLTAPFDSANFGKDINTPYNQSILSGQSHAYYNVQSVVTDPRIGLVYSPENSHGMVIRGGFGLFSDLAPAFLVTNVFNNAPFPYNAQIFDGSTVGPVTAPGSAASTALNQYNTFKSGFFGGQTLAQLQTTLPSFSPFNYFSTPSTFKAPTYAEWSFEIQQPLGAKNVLVATYSGNHGYDLILQNGFANASATGFAGLPSTSPDGRFNQVTQLLNQGVSNYDGLTVQFRRSMGYGFQGQIAYTWSHALDDLSNGGSGLPYSFCSGCSFATLANPNIASNYGNADYDVRHNMTADFTWEMPYRFAGRKLLANLLGNWTIGGKVFLRTGTPFSVIDSALAGSLSPTINATMLASTAVSNLPITCHSSAVDTPCFDTSQFVTSKAETTFGNLGRNAFTGPGYFDMDFTVYKNFSVTERTRIQLGASAYNALNHPNFQNPNADVAGSGFGTITSTAIPPTSAYGSFQGSAVSGRVLVVTGRFNF